MRQSLNGLHTILLTTVVMLLAIPSVFAAPAPPQHADIRVLIDISGSMHKNDPNNLRRPALRMIAGLMQPGTRAGVWTFARWVNNLVPVADVDAAWKKRTQSLSNQISSPGQFTNIEEVLDRASSDWEGEPTTHARHLVLLTDGMVDVSKNDADNSASRERVLDTLLPRLQQAQVKVHTIALSERADHALMKQLAGGTGGWYQQVDSAEELQRVFLKVFETAGKPDAVPLQDNRFVVDGSINEATVLVFNEADSPPVVLRSPNGDEFRDSDLTAGIAWFRDQGYNMITIASPAKGEWRLEADLDPDNRVMVVTDLKLQTSEVPTHIAAGEQTHVEAYLTNKDNLVDRQAFLRLLDVRAASINANGTDPLTLNDAGKQGDEKAADGRYGMQFSEPHAQDSLELLLSVDSPTFMREKRFRLAVHELAEVAVDADGQAPIVKVQATTAVLQDGADISAWQQGADGQRQELALDSSGDGALTATLNDAQSPVYVRVSGTTRLGNLLERTYGPIALPGAPVPAAPVTAPEVSAPAANEAPPTVAEPPAAAAPEPEPAPAPSVPEPQVEEASSDWVLPAAMFGGFNLLLLIGGGVWFFLRRRRAGASDDLDLDLDLDVAEDTTPASEAGAKQDQSQEDAA